MSLNNTQKINNIYEIIEEDIFNGKKNKLLKADFINSLIVDNCINNEFEYIEDFINILNSLTKDGWFIHSLKSIFNKKMDRKQLNFHKKNIIIKKIENEIPLLKNSKKKFFKEKRSEKIIYYIQFYLADLYTQSKYKEDIDKTKLLLKEIQTFLNEKINKENNVIFIDICGSWIFIK